MKKQISALVVFGLALTALGATAGQAQAAGKPDITIAIPSSPASLRAADGLTNGMQPLFGLVYDTLLTFDKSGKIVGNLASSWGYDGTGKTLNLTLRKGVKFTDGSDFNADAVIANIAAVKKGSGNSLSQAASISSVAAGKDQYSVVIKLSDVDPALLNSLTRELGFMESPKQINAADAKTNPIGSGAYTLNLKNTVAGQQYEYDANPGYWNKAVQRFSKITLKVLFDDNALINALKTGQVAMSPISSSQVAPVKAAGVELAQVDAGWQGLTFADKTGTMGSNLDNVRLRQAINYALDRPTLVKVCAAGLGTPTSSVFLPGNGGYTSDLANAYPFNLAKAKSLVASSGVDNPSIKTLDVSGFNPACFAAWKQMIEDAGIKVIPNTSATPWTVIQDIQKPKWPMYWWNNSTPVVEWQYLNRIITRTGAYNGQKYGTASSDNLLSAIRTATGLKKNVLLKSLNAEVTNNAWFAPFFASVDSYAYDSSKVSVWGQPGENIWFPQGVTPKK